MGDQSGFDQKWDFRRKEINFDDSSSDNPDSNSSHEPVLKKHKLVVSQAETTTKSTTTRGSRKQPVKSQKSGAKKDQKKPERGKKTGGARKKTPRGKGKAENGKKKKETGGSEAGGSVSDDVGTFMETLLDDLKASRESLFDWMKAEMCQSEEKGVSPLPEKEKRKAKQVRKRVQPQAKRTVKKRKNSVPKGEKVNKKQAEEENQREERSKEVEIAAEKNNVAEETEHIQGAVQEQSNVGSDNHVGPLERCLRSNKTRYGKNYLHQQKKDQDRGSDHTHLTRRVGSAEKEKPKSNASTSTQSRKTLVLGIPAQNSSLGTAEKLPRGKKVAEAKTVVDITGSETQEDLNSDAPVAVEQKLSSAPLLSAFSSLSSFFPSSNQGGHGSFTSNNFHFRPVSQIQDPSEIIQTGSVFGHQGLRNMNLNGLYQNNGYFPSFGVPFHHGFNFQTQLSSETSLRDNSLFGGLRMSGGAIRFSGGGSPEQFSGADVGTSSDHRLTQFQTHNNVGNNGSLFQN